MGFRLICSAAENFFLWVIHYSANEERTDPGWTPAQYMIEWLEWHESAIDAVAGKYPVFLQTLVVVTAECHRNPTALDLIYVDGEGSERRVSRPPRYAHYLDPPMDRRSIWIDQDEFDSFVYDRHHRTED